jgi:hypothetical protein
MADISMCSDDKCPSAKLCYRHEAKANPLRQSYADFGRKKGAKDCKDMWPIESQSNKKRLDVQTAD